MARLRYTLQRAVAGGTRHPVLKLRLSRALHKEEFAVWLDAPLSLCTSSTIYDFFPKAFCDFPTRDIGGSVEASVP